MLASRMLRRWIGNRRVNQTKLVSRSRCRLQLRSLEERTVPTTYVVNTVIDENDGIGAGGVSLRDAITSANADVTAGPHIIDMTGISGTINLVNSQITVSDTKGLVLNGPGAANLSISNGSGSSATSRLFNVTSAAALTINNVTLSGGDVSGSNNGGAILSNSTSLTLNGVVLSNNKTAGAGGAIATVVTATSLSILNSTVTLNSATSTGGAIFTPATTSSTVTITNSTFSKNTSASTGGALHGSATLKLDITGSTFSQNQTTGTGNGGAIITAGTSTVTINTSSFNSNVSGGDGGAVRGNTSVSMTINDSTFSNNTATTGGALAFASVTATTVTLNRCTVSGNTATTTTGGGIYGASSSTFNINDSSIINNTAKTGGGGIRVNTAILRVSNSTISGNTSQGTTATTGGGGILISSTPNVAIRNSTVTNNTAANSTAKGGGVFINSTSGTVTFNGVIVSANSNPNSNDVGASGVRTILGTNNLITGLDGNITLSNSPNQVGVSAGLAPLFNNGGPTLTHGLRYYSAAKNMGNNIAPALAADQRGVARPVVPSDNDVGSVEGQLDYPFAVSHTLTDVPPAGTPYMFSVTLDDETGINSGKLATGDIVVTGPGGFIVINPTFTGSVPGSGNEVIASFTFNAPGGSWDPAEGGVYTVSFVPGKVYDADGTAHSNPGEVIGTFKVAVIGVLTVDNAGDADDGNYTGGNLTLREAIAISNNSVGGTDTIQFAGGLNGSTITLGSELSIIDSVVILGNGANQTTISGNNVTRHFNINIPNAGNPVSMSGLTLTKGKFTGNAGSITMSDDSLSLTNMVVTENTATAAAGAILLTTGTLKVTDSLFSNNTAGTISGAIDFTTGTVDVLRSTFSGNVAGTTAGVADFSSGTFIANESAFINNVANSTTTGGGVFNLTTGSVTVSNSTFSGNSAPNGTASGGFLKSSSSATLNIRNSTITRNTAAGFGGGFSFTGTTATSQPTVNLTSSIVAQNTSTSTIHHDLYSASTASTIPVNVTLDSSIVGAFTDNDNMTLNGTFLAGDATTALDAKLSALGSYGGPTQSHGLLPGSPAVDAGSNPFGLTVDQRGNTRPFNEPSVPNTGDGSGTDIGAFEGVLRLPQTSAVLPDVIVAGATTYKATVTFTDETGINTNDVDTNDVTFSGPNLVGEVSPTSKTIVAGSFGDKLVTVEYIFTAPGGTWDVNDNGTFTLKMAANQVRDTDSPTPNFVLPGSLGTFQSAIPITIIVDTVADVVNAGDGLTSLREAIATSNDNAKTKGVADIITFAASTNGQTFVLNSELAITDAVVIKGNGVGNTIFSGNATNRVFAFTITGAGPESQMMDLTITKGKVTGSGGAIVMNDDSLTLTRVKVTDSEASSTGGAIQLGATKLRIVDSTFSNNKSTASSGGAIAAGTGSVIEIDRSTLKTNSADNNGGAIEVSSGSLLLTNSTISGNVQVSASSSYGGAGINASTGTVTILNSTMSGNHTAATLSLGGGIRISSSGKLSIFNSTITKNSAGGAGGGGISFGTATASVSISSSIIAQNINATHPDLSAPATLTINSLDNVFGANSDADILLNGSYQAGTLESPLDAKLGPLGNYGGPTQTHPLNIVSPAVDAGSNSSVPPLTTDQRGLSRIVDEPNVNNSGNGSGIDVGSFEGLNPIPQGFIVSLSDITTAGGTSYNFSVIYTDNIGINLGTLGNNDIQISGPGFDDPITATFLSSGAASQAVTANYTFTPPEGFWDAFDDGTYTVTLLGDTVGDGTNSALTDVLGTFRVILPHNLVVDNIADNIDGIYTTGQLTLREAIDHSNKAIGATSTIGFAAGLMGKSIVLASELLITESVSIVGLGAGNLTINANKVGRHFNINIAGAGKAVTLSGLTLTNGTITGDGGSIMLSDDSLTLSNMVVTGNSASSEGGAIYMTTGTLIINDSTFSKNSSTTTGGVVDFSTGTVEFNRSTFSHNVATTNGGVADYTTGTLKITRTTLNGNIANGASTGGGAINLTTGKLFIINSTLSGNKVTGATAIGGAIRGSSSMTLTIDNSTLTENSAVNKGGAIGFSATTATTQPNVVINNSIIAQNHNNAGDHPDMYSGATTVTPSVTANDSILGVAPTTVIVSGSNLQSGFVGSPLNAQLAPLADYGGPTKSHALRFGSPAIDAGSNPLLLTTDQRGNTRPVDVATVNNTGTDASGTDIGAYEGFLVNPTAVLFGTLANVPPTNPTYTFDIVYQDEGTINTGSIDANDVTVLSPGGISFVPLSVANIAGSGGSVTVTYTFSPPGGWDFSENGTYTIRVNAGNVLDTDSPTPNGTLETIIGTFNVGIGGSIVVDLDMDEDDGIVTPGDISLREAIKLANSAGGTVDTITFSPALNGKTITLTLGELKLTDGVVITGPGANLLTIDANNLSRVLNIDDGILGSAGFFQISGLTLTKGKVTGDGGGVFIQDESVTFNDIRITNSTASIDGGGINVEATGATLTIVNSVISGNTASGTTDSDGGGINLENAVALTIQGTTISNNTASDDGGAILFIHTAAGTRTVLIEDSALVNNVSKATTGGGGAINFGGTFASIVIRNSTISGNTSNKDGGALQFYKVLDTTTIQNTTIAYNTANGNGGGINQHTDATGLISLESTIVSDNKGTGGDIQSTVGTIVATKSAIGAFSVANYSDDGLTLIGQALQLGALTNNGGLTPTIRPNSSSPVVNKGFNPNPGTILFDQRGSGFPRQIGSAVDIGAFEVDANIPAATANLSAVTTSGGTKYTFTVTYVDDVAIDYLTIGQGADITVTGPGFGPLTATFVSVDAKANGPTRIATYEFVPPGGSWNAMDNGSYTVTLNKDEVKDASGVSVPSGDLGVISVAIPVIVTVDSLADELDLNYSKGNLSLREAVDLVNKGPGGLSVINFDPAVFASASTITLTLGQIVVSRDVVITGPGANKLTVSGNNASRIFKLDDGSTADMNVSMSGMTLANGFSTGSISATADGGGAIYINSEILNLTQMEFRDNVAASFGGALFGTSGTTVSIESSSFHHNTANGGNTTRGGGAIEVDFNSGSVMVIRNSTFAFNRAGLNTTSSVGGAIVVYSGDPNLTIENSTITQNTAHQAGGVRIFGDVTGIVNIRSSIVSGNTGTSSQPDFQTNTTPTSISFSLIGSTTGIGSGGNLDAYTTANVGYTVQLGPLQNNGGPTSTMALLASNTSGINEGSNLAGLTTDQRGYKRAVGQIDIGAYEVQPPRLDAVVIGDGSSQRSLVRSIHVTFSEPVAFPDGLAAAFDVSRFDKGSPGSVVLSFVHVGADVTITFTTGGAVDVDPGNSLQDGKYRLTINASKISGNGGTLDGDGDFIAEGSPTDNKTAEFHRLFGDGNGDGSVNAVDFAQFRSVFGLSGPSIFDFNNDNTTNAADFAQFRARFGLGGFAP